jgi:hypothetical protein
MASTRRLAAILATDVAGYSRLMSADEESTYERLRAHFNEVVDPKIAEHRGRTVKNTGDGLLAEFPSVVDAVRCAVEVQRGMIDREPGVTEERRIRFRIGVNLGDVIAEGATFTATVSTLLRGWRHWRRRAASPFHEWSGTRSETSCPTSSRTWGNRASRTSPGRCGCMRCAPKPSPVCRLR